MYRVKVGEQRWRSPLADPLRAGSSPGRFAPEVGHTAVRPGSGAVVDGAVHGPGRWWLFGGAAGAWTRRGRRVAYVVQSLSAIFHGLSIDVGYVCIWC